jgi:Ca2+-binding RTX toxin-like protein
MTTLTTGDDVYNVTIKESVYADFGNDTIFVYANSCFVNLGGGNDTLSTRGSYTIAYGEQGTDYFAIGGSSNQIYGGDGNDTIVQQTVGGAVGGNVLNGGAGNDSITVMDDQTAQLFGDDGDDTLTAGAGGQLLNGGTGADSMAGGAGDDTYVVDDAGDTITENANEGLDTVTTTAVSYTLGNNIEILNGMLSTGQTLIGNGGDNYILAGNGDDVIDGGAGNDAMIGGLGNDTYHVDSNGDTISENANEGTADKAITTLATYTLADNVENLDGDGSVNPNQDLTGNTLDNIITANLNGNNVLRGDAGNDTLIALGTGANDLYGGVGDDVYQAGDNTSVHESALEGYDIVRTSSSIFTLSANIEELEGTAATTQYLTGNAQDNMIVARNDVRNFLNGQDGDDNLIATGNGNNVFSGGAGNDTIQAVGTGRSDMAGGTGNDYYFIANGTALITENANEGTDTVKTYLAYFALGNNIENLIGADNNGQYLVGNAENNAITAGAGADILDSGVAGTDTLNGRGGNDTYRVLHDHATVTEAANEGTDTIWFYGSTFTLGTNVENLESKGIAGTSQVLTGNELVNTYISQSGINSTFNALGGNDAIYITDAANHTIDGGDGADHFEKSSGGTVTFVGGTGNDTFNADGGSNTLRGGLGDDTYTIRDASNSIVESANEGTDTVLSFATSYTLAANIENLQGLWDNQTLTGNGLDNEISTGEASINVTVNGGGGNDIILAGGETSTFNGDAGNDTLDGTGETDFNTFAGGAGDDTYILRLNGGMFGSDTITENANEGIDTLQTSAASISLSAIANVENLTGTATTSQILEGNELNNHITGNAGDDTLTGNAGNDDLNGGAGSDAMTGGTGDDTYHFDDAGDTMSELAGEGIDTIITSIDNLVLTDLGDFENVTMTGSGDLTVYGSESDNFLTGNTGANSLYANGGNDTLDGGGGSDTMNGGEGDDIFITDGGDTIDDFGGIDTVRSTVDYMLGDVLENLVLTGTAVSGTGNALGNTITGNASGNTLDGATGADTLVGGGGNDTYVTDGGDVITENASAGTDIVKASVTYTLGNNLESLVLTGTALKGTGNSLINSLTGNASANQLFGMGGADTIIGGAGADKLTGGAGLDKLTGGAGADHFIFNAIVEGGDHIKDFTKGDVIDLKGAAFGKLAAGALKATMFQAAAGHVAQDADNHFLFDTKSSQLWYDADANKAGAAKMIFDLDTTYKMSALDIHII